MHRTAAQRVGKVKSDYQRRLLQMRSPALSADREPQFFDMRNNFRVGPMSLHPPARVKPKAGRGSTRAGARPARAKIRFTKFFSLSRRTGVPCQEWECLAGTAGGRMAKRVEGRIAAVTAGLDVRMAGTIRIIDGGLSS